MSEITDLTSIFGEPIDVYSRADALADGNLRDAGELATEAGFKAPVHLTLDAWTDTVAWDHDDTSQDETGRLWDVLWMGCNAIRRAIRNGATSGPVEFALYRVTAPGREPSRTSLVITYGPGDDAAPVFTIDRPTR